MISTSERKLRIFEIDNHLIYRSISFKIFNLNYLTIGDSVLSDFEGPTFKFGAVALSLRLKTHFGEWTKRFTHFYVKI